jgi:hypothetical protein
MQISRRVVPYQRSGGPRPPARGPRPRRIRHRSPELASLQSVPSRADRPYAVVVAVVIQVVGGSMAGMLLLVAVDVLMALTFALERLRIER